MDITAPRFTDPIAARKHLEGIRWGDEPYCPHCGSTNATRLEGEKHRDGLIQCNDCRKQYTVTVGTVFERSKVPLNKWLLANHLLVASKKGMSAHQLHRMIGVTYKTAWFMFHRLREAMRNDDDTPMGSGGGTVEADETFIGRDRSKPRHKTGYEHKMKVLALVDRETGRSRAVVVDNITIGTVTPIIHANVAKEARLLTDDAGQYRHMHKHFAKHDTSRHTKGEYVNRDDPEIHTNTIEGYFSIFKRGMKGIYQHCGKQHLHRYLAEFDFRYTNREGKGFSDAERADAALKGIEGRRLMYRRPDGQSEASPAWA